MAEIAELKARVADLERENALLRAHRCPGQQPGCTCGLSNPAALTATAGMVPPAPCPAHGLRVTWFPSQWFAARAAGCAAGYQQVLTLNG